MSEGFTPSKKPVPASSSSSSSSTPSRAPSLPRSGSIASPTGSGRPTPVIVIDDEDEDRDNLHVTHAKRRIGAVSTIRKDDDEIEDDDEGSQSDTAKRARRIGSPPKSAFSSLPSAKPKASSFSSSLRSSFEPYERKGEEDEEDEEDEEPKGRDDFDWDYWTNADDDGNISNNASSSSKPKLSSSSSSHHFGFDDDDLIDDSPPLKSSAHTHHHPPLRFSDDEDEGEDQRFQTTTTTTTSSSHGPPAPSHVPAPTTTAPLSLSSSSSSSSSTPALLSSAEAAARARPEQQLIPWRRDRELPKEKGQEITQTEAWNNAAKKHGLKSHVQARRGTQLSEHLTPLPSTLDYTGHRARQVLHHHSEVLRWYLGEHGGNATSTSISSSKKKKKKEGGKEEEVDPVEVQTHYLQRNGKLHLTVSANQHASQEVLAAMTQEDVTRAYLEAAHSTDRLVRRSARKVLAIDEVNARRRATGREDDDDLQRAAALAGMLVDRNAYTVIMNKGERHAEQTLRADYLARGPKPGDITDVAGTLIRCGACSQQVGIDTQLTDIRQANRPTAPRPKDVTGILYMAQISQENMERAAQAYSTDALRMHTGAAERPRSPSPEPERYKPDKPSARPTTKISSTSVVRPGGILSFWAKPKPPSSSSSAPPPDSAPSSSGSPAPTPSAPAKTSFFGSSSSTSSSALPKTPSAPQALPVKKAPAKAPIASYTPPPNVLSLKKKPPSAPPSSSSSTAPPKTSPFFPSKPPPKGPQDDDEDDFA